MAAGNKRRANGWQLGAVILLISGSVFAQGAPAPAPGQQDESLKSLNSMNGRDQLAQADRYLGRMREVHAQVGKLLERARKEKDVIKLNCVNEKLTEIKGNLNIGEAAARNHAEAIARNDTASRTHEFSKVIVIHQKVSILGSEAEQCVGEDIRYTGTTSVVIDAPANLPDDPTRVDMPTPIFPRPEDASTSE